MIIRYHSNASDSIVLKIVVLITIISIKSRAKVDKINKNMQDIVALMRIWIVSH